METDALRAILEALPGRPWIESTIEVAPGTITDVKARRGGARESTGSASEYNPLSNANSSRPAGSIAPAQ